MRVFIFAAVVPIIATPAVAQEALHRKVYACAQMADAGQRHSCFDALVPELKKAGESQFGAPAAKASPLTAPVVTAETPKTPKQAAPSEPDKVSLAVKSMSRSTDGKLRFTMENGQIWKQIDTTMLRNIGEAPWTAEIRKASFGSFLLSLNGGKAVRVERVN
ncbi:MAG: hypothetical protein QM773_18015 [Hyphomonadaceae bacterium]